MVYQQRFYFATKCNPFSFFFFVPLNDQGPMFPTAIAVQGTYCTFNVCQYKSDDIQATQQRCVTTMLLFDALCATMLLFHSVTIKDKHCHERRVLVCYVTHHPRAAPLAPQGDHWHRRARL